MTPKGLVDRIGLDRFTRLQALFRFDNHWRAWTAVKDLRAPYDLWQGTFFELHDNGEMKRITIYPDYTEHHMTIRKHDDDE